MNTLAEEKEIICLDSEVGWLVFAPADTLTAEERERADLHLSQCLACQIDVDIDYFLSVSPANNKTVLLGSLSIRVDA